MTYALDTNIIIHLLSHTQSVLEKRDEVIKRRDRLVIPPYVNYEIRRGFRYVSAPVKERAYSKLRFRFAVGEMNEEIQSLFSSASL